MKKLLIIPVLLIVSCGKSPEQLEVERFERMRDSLSLEVIKAKDKVAKEEQELKELKGL